MMSTQHYWPFDLGPEEEIYDNLSWDLPGLKPRPRLRGSQNRPLRRGTRRK